MVQIRNIMKKIKMIYVIKKRGVMKAIKKRTTIEVKKYLQSHYGTLYYILLNILRLTSTV